MGNDDDRMVRIRIQVQAMTQNLYSDFHLQCIQRFNSFSVYSLSRHLLSQQLESVYGHQKNHHQVLLRFGYFTASCSVTLVVVLSL